jgi:hypothetical protein
LPESSSSMSSNCSTAPIFNIGTESIISSLVLSTKSMTCRSERFWGSAQRSSQSTLRRRRCPVYRDFRSSHRPALYVAGTTEANTEGLIIFDASGSTLNPLGRLLISKRRRSGNTSFGYERFPWTNATA